MTWPTALPGAALRILRVLRGAAGRRVVQLALLVGGLFALGFLCGEQAHAAEGLSAPARSAPALSAPARSAPVLSVPAGVTDQVETLSSVPGAGDVVVAAVGEQRERLSAQVSWSPVSPSSVSPSSVSPSSVSSPPVSSSPRPPISPALPEPPDLSELPQLADLPELPGVSGPTGLPSPPALPVLPDLPAIPDLPALPVLPALPDLPALPSVPVRTLPVPVVEVPGQGAVATPSPDGHGLGDRKTADAVPEPVTAKVTAADAAVDAETASYGPVSTGGGSVDVGHRVASARTGQAPVHAPAHAPGPVRRGPAGDRDGVLAGGASVLDGGASRHGDTHAVTPRHQFPPRPVPGSAARSEAAGTRDGHRTIPVFPG
ncbi:hypothetical protein [Streptomyces sp. NBC_01334]|uniref:hypothetical protein n=1 Tax=Streptomyces sp. NBC_01334 TaxID=2903827 RepID=UPI002E0E20A7|nr:hypothetical protein OG736_26905 [Streptomyces sp. NBC_01334]